MYQTCLFPYSQKLKPDFESWYKLGYTLHHELIHAYHHSSGMYLKWMNAAGGEATGVWYAHYMSEYLAYKASYEITGDILFLYESDNNKIDADNEYKVWGK